jgi:hypothetical protein
MAVLMGMEAPLGREGLFLFGIGDSYGEDPKKDGAVESHPSATGWGTREHFLTSSIEGRALARPAGGDARGSIVFVIGAVQTR